MGKNIFALIRRNAFIEKYTTLITGNMFFSLVIAAVLSLLYYVIQFFFVNASALPPGINDAFTQWSAFLHTGTALFPIPDLLRCLGVIVVVEVSIWAVSFTLFIIKRVHK